MNPLGDETGLLIMFGLTAVLVLAVTIRARATRHPIAIGAFAGILCGAAMYALIAVISVAFHGFGGYQPLTWLIFVGAGAVPAAVIGLVEGLVASSIIRLFA